jgi:molybdate transport system substrate-binding protein
MSPRALALLVGLLALPACGKAGSPEAGPPPAATTAPASPGAPARLPDDVALQVAAASSLRELLEDTAPLYVARDGGALPTFAFEASSTLARQIGEGAAFDVFLSADDANVDRVAAQIDPATRRAFLGNRLVLAGRPGLAPAPTGPQALAQDPAFARTSTAWAAPAVPAGRYAREWLTAQGLLAPIEARAVNADSVRAALALLESGTVDCAFVYRTDAMVAAKTGVTVLWTAPEDAAPRIACVAAALVRAQGGRAAAARAYLGWLGSEEFLARAADAGFLPPPAAARQ